VSQRWRLLLLQVSCITKAWIGKFEVVGSEFVGERVEKSGYEVPADALQNVRTRDPFEHAHVP